MVKNIFYSLVFIILVVPSSYAALYDRGGNLVYDTVLDVTWLMDANYIYTSGAVSINNPVTWEVANSWVDSLDYGGGTDWRLPTAKQPDDSGPFHGAGAYGELGYLYYTLLGNNENTTEFNNVLVLNDFSSFPIVNLQIYGYWAAEVADYGTFYRWTFSFVNGFSDYIPKDSARFVLAVHDGDIVGGSLDPPPATVFSFKDTGGISFKNTGGITFKDY